MHHPTAVRLLLVASLAILSACGEATWECIDLQTDEVVSSGVMDCEAYRQVGWQLLGEEQEACDDALGDRDACMCTFVDHTCGDGPTND